MKTIRSIGRKIKDRIVKTEILKAKYVRPDEEIVPQTLLPQATSLDNIQSTSLTRLGKVQVYVFRTDRGERTFPSFYFSDQPTSEEDYSVKETSLLGFPVSRSIRKI